MILGAVGATEPSGLPPEAAPGLERVRIPRRITAGYHHGTDEWAAGQFIRWTVDEVLFS